MTLPNSTLKRLLARTLVGGAVGLAIGLGATLIGYDSGRPGPSPVPSPAAPQPVTVGSVSRAAIFGELVSLYLVRGDTSTATRMLQAAPPRVRSHALKHAIEKRSGMPVVPGDAAPPPGPATAAKASSITEKLIPLIDTVEDPAEKAVLFYQCAMGLPADKEPQKVDLLARAISESDAAARGTGPHVPDTAYERLPVAAATDWRFPSLPAIGYAVVTAVIAGISSPVLQAAGKVFGRGVAGVLRLPAIQQALSDGRPPPADPGTQVPPPRADAS